MLAAEDRWIGAAGRGAAGGTAAAAGGTGGRGGGEAGGGAAGADAENTGCTAGGVALGPGALLSCTGSADLAPAGDTADGTTAGPANAEGTPGRTVDAAGDPEVADGPAADSRWTGSAATDGRTACGSVATAARCTFCRRTGLGALGPCGPLGAGRAVRTACAGVGESGATVGACDAAEWGAAGAGPTVVASGRADANGARCTTGAAWCVSRG
ncbi:hypothetical protein GXW83_20185 [Streptacidiphilus sp. PB12-B1b]|uniref:hypothetical protein n=1 Tax=Streptacidiphilus sp. PB12-B1b TaxID=2705012 RepID=UPI0015FA6AD6|nr:hypothetical protein [Streptacidiphilus sp. PB12-B1b]QMU77665.1 hypothetical protein GXW83_20185 [Streptacidiphilus sp. PB12-B1b]